MIQKENKIMKDIADVINSKPAEGLTNFFTEVVGKPLIDIAGYFYVDSLRLRREHNILKLKQNYNSKRPKELKHASLTFAYNLFEKASLEEDNYLLEKWAELLIKATDKNYESPIRKIYIEILEKVEPSDMQLFEHINLECERKDKLSVFLPNLEHYNRESLKVLQSVGLIEFRPTSNGGLRKNRTDVHRIVDDYQNIMINELGYNFYQAIKESKTSE